MILNIIIHLWETCGSKMPVSPFGCWMLTWRFGCCINKSWFSKEEGKEREVCDTCQHRWTDGEASGCSWSFPSWLMFEQLEQLERWQTFSGLQMLTQQLRCIIISHPLAQDDNKTVICGPNNVHKLILGGLHRKCPQKQDFLFPWTALKI